MAGRNILNGMMNPFDDEAQDAAPARTMEEVSRAMYGHGAPPARGLPPGERMAQPKGLAVRGPEQQQLVPSSGAVVLGRVRLTRVGLSIPEDLSFDEYEQARAIALHLEGMSQWALGDILVFGERKHGESYRQAAIDANREVKTLRNYASVARRVEMSRRRDTLSFGHHEAVAKLDPQNQDAWLDYADRMGLSVPELRAALRGEKPPRPPSAMPPEVKAHLVYLGALTGIPYDRAAKEELRERIHQARAWLDALENELA